MFAVALYTFGSFHGWATDPMDREDVDEFVRNPPPEWAPRPQDQLVIFSLEREEADDER